MSCSGHHSALVDLREPLVSAQVERKRAEEEAQRRAEDLKRDAEREEARRRAEADAQLKVRYYEVIRLPPCSPALTSVTCCASEGPPHADSMQVGH